LKEGERISAYLAQGEEEGEKIKENGKFLQEGSRYSLKRLSGKSDQAVVNICVLG
jgi:hypothetical protein